MSGYFAKGISVKRLTKGKLPSLPFMRMKNEILGKKYELSVTFAGEKDSKDLNRKYRGKNKPTNILSFQISKNEGELIINLKKVRSDAPLFEKSYPQFLGQLVIHGMLHLKGMAHGSKMNTNEEKFIRKFKL